MTRRVRIKLALLLWAFTKRILPPPLPEPPPPSGRTLTDGEFAALARGQTLRSPGPVSRYAGEIEKAFREAWRQL